jgi:UDP-N-acetylenolpyruvoylglucosamine reductase
MRDLARRLLTSSQSAADSDSQEAVLVNEKLRIALIQVAGADGFTALLRRALALASVEAPALKNATVSADGRLEGLEQLATLPGSVAGAAAVAITAHLLELLVTFIGEHLTLRLVRQAWPNISLGE